MYARFRNPTFRGCAFINTIVELARDSHPAVQAARAHKNAVRALVKGYLVDAGYKSAEELSVVFMQLMDGALVTALREGQPDAALRAKDIAKVILAEHDREINLA